MASFERTYYEVYIKINDENYITSINSSAFLKDTDNWILIDSGYGDRFHHAQHYYLEKPVVLKTGIFNYKYINNEIISCSDEEISFQEQKYAELRAAQPSQWEKIDARLSYIEMMTGLMEV